MLRISNIREVFVTMRRRYMLLNFRKVGREYLGLAVQYRDEHGTWHSKVIKSYGQNGVGVLVQAQTNLAELVRVASGETAPIPTGMVDELIWASFYQNLKKPLTRLYLPRMVGHDLGHLAASIINSMSINLEAQIKITQPSMKPAERQQFLSWLEQQAEDAQASILAYQWKYKL